MQSILTRGAGPSSVRKTPEPGPADQSERIRQLEATVSALSSSLVEADNATAAVKAENATMQERLHAADVAHVELEGRLAAESAHRVSAEGRAVEATRVLDEARQQHVQAGGLAETASRELGDERQRRAAAEARAETLAKVPAPSAPQTVVVERTMQPTGWTVSLRRDQVGRISSMNLTPTVKE